MTVKTAWNRCSDLVSGHLCEILAVIGPTLFAAIIAWITWYATTNAKLDQIPEMAQALKANTDTLQQIQIDVATIKAKQGPNPFGVAGNP